MPETSQFVTCLGELDLSFLTGIKKETRMAEFEQIFKSVDDTLRKDSGCTSESSQHLLEALQDVFAHPPRPKSAEPTGLYLTTL